MIVNRRLSERLFVWVAVVLASCGAVGQPVDAQDSSRGWEGANVGEENNIKQEKPAETGSEPPAGTSPGWNSKAAESEALAGASTNVYQTGDTALSAGRFAEALQNLDEAWRNLGTKADSKTTALFLERRALALRGVQRLSDAERSLKQAIGHATAGGAKHPSFQARLLFEVADIQSQEGLPRDSAVSANQALTALSGTKNSNLAVEILNLQGRALTDSGDTKLAQVKLNEALAQVETLPPAMESDNPPASPISKYSEHLKGKIKVNTYHWKDTTGGAGAAKSDLDEAQALMKNYDQGLSPDSRYSPLTVGLSKKPEALGTLLEKASTYPGPDNLIKAAVLSEKARVDDRNGDFKGVAEALKEALAIRSKALPANSTYLAETLVQLSSAQLKAGKASDAAAHAQRACSILERSAGRESLDFARALVALSEVYMASNKFGPVEPLILEAVGTLSRIRGNADAETLHAMDMLSSTYVRNKKYALAAKYSELALKGGEKTHGPSSPKIVLSLMNLGTASAHSKKFAEADRYLGRAQNILSREGKSGSPEYADLLACMGVSYTVQKKWGPAANSLKQARSIYATRYGANSQHVSQMTELLKTMEALKAGPRTPGQNILLENKFTPKRPDYR